MKTTMQQHFETFKVSYTRFWNYMMWCRFQSFFTFLFFTLGYNLKGEDGFHPLLERVEKLNQVWNMKTTKRNNILKLLKLHTLDFDITWCGIDFNRFSLFCFSAFHPRIWFKRWRWFSPSPRESWKIEPGLEHENHYATTFWNF